METYATMTNTVFNWNGKYKLVAVDFHRIANDISMNRRKKKSL